MNQVNSRREVFRFGVFEADLRTGELLKQGRQVKLQEQPFQILGLLLARPGELVTREELRQALWPADTFVDFEHGLNKAVSKLREALGDDSGTPRYVETLPRRGYRFIAPVSSGSPPSGPGESHAAPEDQPGPVVAGTRRSAGWKKAATGVGLALLALLAWEFLFRVGRWRPQSATVAFAAPIHSLAVLPLENLSGNQAQEYFAEGMTDELITTLGEISSLRVISRTSVMRYKDTKEPLPQIARELNVDAIVEGTVLRSGNRVRITANLLYAPGDRHLWSETYERNLGDVLTLQGEVAQAIAREVQAKLTPREQTRLAQARPVNPAAHRLYLLGRFYWNKQTEKGYQHAIDYFQRAIEIDPDYASAYAELADSYIWLCAFAGGRPKEVFPKAKAAARKALEIDEGSAEAHAALARAYFEYDWNWAAAEKEYKRAIELNPNSATVRCGYSFYLCAMRRYAEGIREAQRAQQLDPLSPTMDNNLAICYIYARQFDKALRQCQDTASLFPEFVITYENLTFIYIAQRRYQDAVAADLKAISLAGGSATAVAALRQAYAKGGTRGFLLWLIRKLHEFSKHRYVPASEFAYLYAGLGDKDQAFSYMEKAYQQRDRRFAILQVTPGWDPLRSDPRFQKYLRRMNFPK